MDHLVAARRHANDGGIKGAAAEIIHHDEFTAGAGTGTAGVMGIFDARRRRLIEQPTDLKAGAAEGLQCQEALVTIGMSGDSDHRFDAILLRQRPRSDGAVFVDSH